MIAEDKSPEMNVPAASDGQPPYLARLHEMSFGELRKVIDDSLTALAEPGSDADRPRSKEEFLELADMLDAKLDELRKEAAIPTPPPPAYDGPPYVPPWFNPSDQLSSLHDRHERFSERLLEAQGDPSSGKRYMDHVERELRGSANRRVAYVSRNNGKAVESLLELPSMKSCQPIGGSS